MAERQQKQQRRTASGRKPWNLHPSEIAGETLDPLLGCLVALTKIYGSPRSPDALAAGLPLENNRFTPELFVRAAARVGMSARRTIRKLEDIPDMVLPAVLLLGNGSACVLLRREGDKAVILLPETGEGVMRVKTEQLATRYSGYAIFVRPQVRLDRSADEGSKDDERGKGWFWGTLLQFWPTYAQVIVASFILNCFVLASPLFIRNVYDRVVPNQAFETLWVLAIGMLVILGFEFVLQILRSYFLDTAGRRADVIISSKIFSHVLNMQMRGAPKSSGAFANRLREFEVLRDFITSSTLVVLVDLPFVALFLFVIWLIGGGLVWIPIGAIPVVIGISLLLQAPMRKAVQSNMDQNAQKHGMIIESLGALETVKSLSMEGRLQKEWEHTSSRAASTGLWTRLVANLGVQLSHVATRLVTLVTVIYGVYLIADGQLSVGALIACTIIAGRTMGPVVQAANLLGRFNHAAAAHKGLQDIMALPVDREEDRNYLSRRRFRGYVEFRNVTFTYPGASTPALRNVSFKIKAGEHVGFIGPVGSGKTTIGRLLNGIYIPDEGTVLIDGTDIRQIDPADLRRAVGMVQQDIVLFRGTVKENIIVGAPYADDNMVLQAAELAGVHEFVRRHPLGYELPVGEKGRELSGGQRQSIALARAILPDPPIFLMDEPTSMMDVKTEHDFITRIRDLMADRTLMAITHRPSLFPLVDRLIVIKNGKVAMDAPRSEVEKLGKPRPAPPSAVPERPARPRIVIAAKRAL